MSQVQPQQAQPAPPPTVSNASSSGIPLSLKITLWSLVALTICVIFALFAGDVPYRGEKIFATVLYFATFVGLTIFDMSIAKRSASFPTQLAIGSNVFILAFGLLTTWVVHEAIYTFATDYGSNYEVYNSNHDTSLLWFIPVILSMKAVVYGGAGLIKLSRTHPKRLETLVLTTIGVAVAAVVGMNLAQVLYSSFGVEVNDVYWKVIIAFIMLVALGVSSAFLLAWYTRFNDPDYQALKAQRDQQRLDEARARVASYQGPARVQHSGNRQFTEWPVDANGYWVPRLPNGTPDLRYAWWNQQAQSQQPVVQTPSEPLQQAPQASDPVPAPDVPPEESEPAKEPTVQPDEKA